MLAGCSAALLLGRLVAVHPVLRRAELAELLPVLAVALLLALAKPVSCTLVQMRLLLEPSAAVRRLLADRLSGLRLQAVRRRLAERAGLAPWVPVLLEAARGRQAVVRLLLEVDLARFSVVGEVVVWLDSLGLI